MLRSWFGPLDVETCWTYFEDLQVAAVTATVARKVQTLLLFKSGLNIDRFTPEFDYPVGMSL